ncbi:MAG: hypothetical protein VX641_07360 [Planctomycetota bacterium]|nr:hypothetical protein [Planctomycetota bacterium]
MREALIRYTTLFGSLFLVSLMAIPVLAWRTSDRGVPAATSFEALSPMAAWVWVLASFVVFTAIAAFVSRVINVAVALFVLGFGFCVIALACGNVQEFVWSGGGPVSMAIETLLLGVLVTVVSLVIFRISGGLPEIPRAEGTPEIVSRDGLLNPKALSFLAFGFVAVAVCWALLSSMRSGQVLGAVFVGCWVAATIARLSLPAFQPVLLFAGPILCGGVVQLVLASGTGGDLSDLLVTGDYPRLLWPTPLDWTGGTLAGTAFGLGFARMFFEGSLVVEQPGDWAPAPREA